MQLEFEGHKFRIAYGVEYLHPDGELRNYWYQDFVKLLNPQIEKWWIDEEDAYQGEWFAVGRDHAGCYYFQQGSFGSCSGCDWLESISDLEDAIEFLKAMKKLTPMGCDPERVIAYLMQEKINLCFGSQALQKLIDKIREEIIA